MTSLFKWTLLLVALIGTALAWRYTPLSQWAEPELIREVLEGIRQLPYGPVIVIGLFILGGILIMPVTALIVATTLTYGGLAGFIYSLLGALANASVLYAIGAGIGRNRIRQLAGHRINTISRKLGRRGILTVLFVRVVPVAPFSIINLVAGASHVTFRDYLLGTLLGMAPGILAISLLVDRIVAMIEQPTPRSIAVLVAVIAALLGGGYGFSRWIRAKQRQQPPAVGDKSGPGSETRP